MTWFVVSNFTFLADHNRLIFCHYWIWFIKVTKLVGWVNVISITIVGGNNPIGLVVIVEYRAISLSFIALFCVVGWQTTTLSLWIWDYQN